MKQSILLAFILMALASVTADAQTKNAAPPTGDNAATKEIRGWLDRWTKAFTEKDVDAIMALYADDVVANGAVPPLQYVGKSAYRGDYQQFLSPYDNLHVEVRDLHVGATGDLGYAAAGINQRGANERSEVERLAALYITVSEVGRSLARLSRSRLGPS
jgi:ketosteroid isomerase-like protein